VNRGDPVGMPCGTERSLASVRLNRRHEYAKCRYVPEGMTSLTHLDCINQKLLRIINDIIF
jgi:hypothetical protein